MRRLLTPGWLVGHVVAVVLVVGMLVLARWQLTRATGGNTLSWGYTLQWPVFAGFVIFMWWREIQRTLRGSTAGSGWSGEPAAQASGAYGVPRSAAYDDADDPELAAYNRYLAWLHAHPGARPSDYPG